MSRFFLIQNLIMSAMLLFTGWAGLRFLGSIAPLVGMFITTMLIAGLGSYGYHFDQRTDKEDLWRAQWFKKDYLVEIFATLVAALFMFGLSFLVWESFFRALSGASFGLTIIYIWEWLYSRVIMKWY